MYKLPIGVWLLVGRSRSLMFVSRKDWDDYVSAYWEFQDWSYSTLNRF